jgi:phosphoglycolate phosphatase-like HAD superfamily hydrolase
MEKALFFDFDGVILNSVNIKTEAFYDMFLPFGKNIADKVVAHHLEHGGVSRFEKFKLYYFQYLGIEINNQKLEELSKEFSGIVLQKVLQSNFINGVVDFIENHNKNYLCYIVSGTPELELRYIVSEREISHLFKGVYGSPLNKIKIVQKILSEEKIDISNSYFLGDASTDLEAAKYFNLKFVLVKSPDNKKLEAASDIVIENFISFKI